jgi:RHS repeat-associated protein
VHSDALGSVRALTDEAGVAAEQRGYEAFGTMNAQSGTDPLPYRFAGESYDSTSKLAYHRARWMDSRVGRFQGMDPWEGSIQSPTTLHRYFYGANNPVSVVDPTGRSFSMVSVSVGVAIMGITATIAGASISSDTVVTPLTAIDVTVIYDGSLAGWEAGFFRAGEIYMTDAESMVANVKKKLRGRKISTLKILDHSSSYPDGSLGYSLGATEEVNLKNFHLFTDTFSQLKDEFAPGGYVYLEHCQIGQNQELLRKTSAAFGVPVRGNTGNTNAALGVAFFGNTVLCSESKCDEF